MAERRRVEQSRVMLLWFVLSLCALCQGQNAHDFGAHAAADPIGNLASKVGKMKQLARERRNDYAEDDDPNAKLEVRAPGRMMPEESNVMGQPAAAANDNNFIPEQQGFAQKQKFQQPKLAQNQPFNQQNNLFHQAQQQVDPQQQQQFPKQAADFQQRPGAGPGFGVGAPAPAPAAQGQGAAARKPTIKLLDHPACQKDVKHYCGTSTNNFAVLDCLQNDLKSDQDISVECQNVVWSYKYNLTTDVRFEAAAKEVCKDDLDKFTECKALHMAGKRGNLIPCLIDYKSNISIPSCRTFLTKMASIVFGDYRLIQKLVESCSADISTHSCGLLHEENDHSPHSQGRTVECLSQHVKELDPDCKHEILRIAELQADDYHLDRPLFFACRDDRERLCQRTKAGSGKVYKCLMRHKFDREMSSKCREKLTQRQVLMQANFKVNKGLAEACQRDITENRCIHDSDPGFKHARLSKVVLCLENVMKEGKQVDQECVIELKEVRKSLMEDYKISPEIVDSCALDIRLNCKGMQREGATLHCLMDLARPKPGKLQARLESECMGALTMLIKEVDPGSEWSLDPALREACQSMVDVHCASIKEGEGRVLSCLMEHLDSNDMSAVCEERLMEIHYFLARDFSLDPRLYRQCHEDAMNLCHAEQKWHETQKQNPEQGPLTFACLYRHLKLYANDRSQKLSRSCAFEVRRVMRQRAVSVELEPRIEEPCMGDLGAYCSEKVSRGEEMECLQRHFEELMIECKYAVGNFTEDEDADPRMDRILMRACSPMIKDFCEDDVKKEASPGELMKCLIENKDDEDMDEKCAAGIKHHQMITLQDYHFSIKFKDACKEDVVRHCPGSRKKPEVVECLSRYVRDAVLQDESHVISRKCRKQLSFELLQRSEDIDLDPQLEKMCHDDISKFCGNKTPGQASVIDCLKKNAKTLSENCDKFVFKREEDNAIDPRSDYLLMHTCKRMIKKHCMDEEMSRVFPCLVKAKNEKPDFDMKCTHVLVERMRQKTSDVHLNPMLLKACAKDIVSFCKKETDGSEPGHHKVGPVITCLKTKFAQGNHLNGALSQSCRDHLRGVIKEAALDYKQDPKLAASCNNEIKTYCQDEADTETAYEPDGGRVVACLKQAVAEAKITLGKNQICIQEVARVLAEDRADIQVDPILYRECSTDIQHYCFDVPRGEGRQMSCMLAALEDSKVKLKPTCRQMLNDRVKMWEMAAKVAPPDSMVELARQVTMSDSRNYFFGVIFTMIGFIFIGGLMCGRITKRVRQEMKNR